jgi:hypothetical protein
VQAVVIAPGPAIGALDLKGRVINVEFFVHCCCRCRACDFRIRSIREHKMR